MVSMPLCVGHLLNCQELSVLHVLGFQAVTEEELHTPLHTGSAKLKDDELDQGHVTRKWQL